MRRLLLPLLAPLMVAGLPAAAAEIAVAAKDDAYAPRTISARVGDVLKFSNQDYVDHMVLVPTFGHMVNLGVMKPGQSSPALPLGKAGTFDVHCVFHPGMKAKVTVAP
ncbi:MAG: amicyanin [Alphaproteobacteria bacterium]|nr:amicyanin [Alphaproteobacteria bacterium]